MRVKLSPLLPILILLPVAAGGCAVGTTRVPTAASATHDLAAVELRKTPFYPQRRYQCGPAALATVLTATGTAVAPDALVPEVYIPEKRGSLQLELMAATRRRGLIPYVIEPDFAHLVGELRAGRPVLVLQNLGFRRYPVWHYAVVIGIEPRTSTVLLRSGPYERLAMSAPKFRSTWDGGGRWGVVILRPGELPESPDIDRYLGEIAALEALGRWDAAARGYAAALQRWPGNELALLGLGNVHYHRGRLGPAESAYRSLIALRPGHAAAANNLAQVLADRGCLTEARTAIDHALSAAPEHLQAALQRTRTEIYADPRVPAADCESQSSDGGMAWPLLQTEFATEGDEQWREEAFSEASVSSSCSTPC